jgi:hypothetical protein
LFSYPSKVNSISFKFLADELGRRVQDLVLSSFLVFGVGFATSQVPIQVTEFYHPSHVRCLKLLLSDEQQDMLKSSGTNGGIVLTMMYDIFSTGLYKYFNGSEMKPKFPTTLDLENSEVKAPDWFLKLENAFIVTQVSSARFYFVPRGEYPSTNNKNILLSPGNFHTVEIGMEDFSYQADQFQHLCMDSHPAVDFVNPYTNEAETFNYSVGFCQYSVMQQQMMSITNSSVMHLPEPAPKLTNNNFWDARNRNSVLRVTDQMAAEIVNLTTPIEICRRKTLCSTRKYSVHVSSCPWPDSTDLLKLIQLIKTKSVTDSAVHQYCSNVLNDSNKFEEAKEFAEKNFVKIHLLPKHDRGDLFKFCLDYGIENFLSDFGGIAGIYLGASVLTIGETIELISTLLVANFPFSCKNYSEEEDTS